MLGLTEQESLALLNVSQDRLYQQSPFLAYPGASLVNGKIVLPALSSSVQLQDWLKQNSTLIYVVAAGLVALVVFKGFMRR